MSRPFLSFFDDSVRLFTAKEAFGAKNRFLDVV